ncbi:uncharacterized protein LOC108095673 [Drosophila ficusphila]|uniref:uncharacterized protein LOC108095673 n=1 Tax=Drosophila ficusphila TaxID=30025 RepID=UPI001C8AACC7|nr:uncharacterized protein LOC108095673 [Drosophila ficusphila]
MMLLQLGSVALFFCLASGASNFPPEIPRCHHGDTSCIISVSHTLIKQHARTGYPAVGFPQVEPFLIKRFDISDGRSGSLNLKLNFRDVNVEGLSGVKFDRAVGFGPDPATSKFEMYGSFPKITMKGKYVADGRILILPIRGDGDAEIVLHNPKFSVKFKPGTQQRDGRTFLSVDKLKVLVEPQKMNIKLANLFNGDQALGTNLNQFLNDNWTEVWNELHPSIHLAIAEIMKSILTQLFKRFAYEDLFLENCYRPVKMFRIALAVAFCLFVSVQAIFPDDPKPCKYGDGECIIKLCNTLFSQRSSEEEPGLNLKSLDPLKVDKMIISQGESSSAVGISLTFTDNLLYGIKDQRVVKVKGFGKDLTTKHEVRLVTKTISLIGPYTIQGKVLILPISGTGISNMTMANIKVIVSFWGKPLEKNGETYLDVTDLKFTMKPESNHYHFTNLFNGDKALGDNMNVFLNENSEAIYKETASAIDRAFSELYLGVVKGVFSKLPYAKFFAGE